jgi:hypothetical protein
LSCWSVLTWLCMISGLDRKIAWTRLHSFSNAACFSCPRHNLMFAGCHCWFSSSG